MATSSMLDFWFDVHATRLQGIIAAHTPYKNLSPRFKPWWSCLLSVLRWEYHSRTRAHKKHPSSDSAKEARGAKQAYFSAIRHAKNSYWKAFLVEADDRSV